MTRIVFAIDDQSMTGVKKFLRYADGIRVMNNVDIRMCIGYWEGEMEHSFICSNEDYEKYFQSFARNQGAVLVIHNGGVAELHYQDGYYESIGVWQQVEDVSGLAAWIYDMEQNTYWVAK